MSLEDIIYSNSFLLELSRKVMGLGYRVAPSLMIRIVYRLRLGQWPNLKHPQTFNEKIQWMRLHDKDPRKTRLADKYLVREWVAENIGDDYLIPLLGVWDKIEEINFDLLPSQFVLKANHGSGWNIVVRDKSQLDYRDVKKMCHKWLHTNYGKENLEPQYVSIPPKLIVEEYLENEGGNLYDYKVHCFQGKAKFIHYIGGRATNDTCEVFYDAKWNRMPFTTNSYPRFKSEIPKPDNLDELLHLAESLAGDFDYVRVDIYVLNNGTFKFGEMTFTPGAGVYHWEPEEYDLEFGKLIKLPIDE